MEIKQLATEERLVDCRKKGQTTSAALVSLPVDDDPPAITQDQVTSEVKASSEINCTKKKRHRKKKKIAQSNPIPLEQDSKSQNLCAVTKVEVKSTNPLPTAKASAKIVKSKKAKEKISKEIKGNTLDDKELNSGDNNILSSSNSPQEEISLHSKNLSEDLYVSQTVEGTAVTTSDLALPCEDICGQIVSLKNLSLVESPEVVHSHNTQSRTTECTPWSCSSDKDIQNFLTCFGVQNNKADLGSRPLTIGSHLGLSSKDAELLKSASHLGPLYSRSSITSPLTVTCSSSSTQLSTDRLHSSRLYGGTVLQYPSVSGCNLTNFTSERTETMKSSDSAPADGKKSREEIEAERKARKAIKQASKHGKGKTAAASTPAPSDKGSVEQSTKAVCGNNDTTRAVPQSSPLLTQNCPADRRTVAKAPVPSNITETMKASDLAPADGNKSREEIEAERKVRKAAKQAAKQGKGKIEAESMSSLSSKGSLDTNLTVLQSSSNADKNLSGRMENLAISKQSGQLSDSEKKVSVTSSLLKQNFNEDLKTKEGKGKAPPCNASSVDKESKSKAELRAERRAKQEAQRAAKAQQQEQTAQKEKQPQQQKQQPTAGVSIVPAVQSQVQVKPAASKLVKEVKDASRVKLFSHIQYTFKASISRNIRVNHPEYHPAIVRLGVQYAKRTILGSNARCVALLHCLKEVIEDYKTPPQKEFSRGLEGHFQANVEFLQQCRPLSVSMNNALRHIKRQLTQLPNNVSDNEARRKLQVAVDEYIRQEIETAAEAIGITVKDKITDGDVILVYACSSLVLHAVSVAHKEGRQFRVVVVDSMPWLEGREMLRRLVTLGLHCSYVHISAASFVMRKVTKVLLGAHALLANGYVMSRAGSSQIALLAHTYNVPVLVCCETHKFSERVQTDSFVYNELGNPDELVGTRRVSEREAERERPLAKWRDMSNLSLLNLVYDVTPPDLVTAVVTERAILPCTSVPVILRIKPTEC